MILSLKKIAVIVMLVAMAVSCSGRGPILLPPPVFDDPVTYYAQLDGDYVMVGEPYSIIVFGSDGSIQSIEMEAETESGMKSIAVPGFDNLVVDIYFADTVLTDFNSLKSFLKADSEYSSAVIEGTIDASSAAPFDMIWENDDSSIYGFGDDDIIQVSAGTSTGDSYFHVNANNVTLNGFTLEYTGSSENDSYYIFKVSCSDAIVDKLVRFEAPVIENMNFITHKKCAGINIHGVQDSTSETGRVAIIKDVAVDDTLKAPISIVSADIIIDNPTLGEPESSYWGYIHVNHTAGDENYPTPCNITFKNIPSSITRIYCQESVSAAGHTIIGLDQYTQIDLGNFTLYTL